MKFVELVRALKNNDPNVVLDADLIEDPKIEYSTFFKCTYKTFSHNQIQDLASVITHHLTITRINALSFRRDMGVKREYDHIMDCIKRNSLLKESENMDFELMLYFNNNSLVFPLMSFIEGKSEGILRISKLILCLPIILLFLAVSAQETLKEYIKQQAEIDNKLAEIIPTIAKGNFLGSKENQEQRSVRKAVWFTMQPQFAKRSEKKPSLFYKLGKDSVFILATEIVIKECPWVAEVQARQLVEKTYQDWCKRFPAVSSTIGNAQQSAAPAQTITRAFNNIFSQKRQLPPYFLEKTVPQGEPINEAVNEESSALSLS